MNKPPYGNSIRLLDIAQQFKASAQDQPNKTIKVNAGTFISGSGNIIEFNGGNSPLIVAPTTGNAWTLISISPIGSLTVTTAPTPPTVAKNFLAVALVFLKNTDTNITNDMIFDIRPIFHNAHYATNHNELLNLTDSNAHPISSITGLSDALADKVSINEFENGILNKANVDGTISPTFTFNSDQTGTPAENVEFIVKRGSAPSVSIRWNETDDRWEFTNDGNQWFEFSNAGFVGEADIKNTGTVLLSVAPVKDPIAVGDNDPRLITLDEKSSVLSHIIDHNDPHNTLALLTADKLPAHTHPVVDKSIQVRHLDPDLASKLVMLSVNTIPGLNADLLDGYNASDFASVSHNHDSVYALIDHKHPEYVVDLSPYLTKDTADQDYATISHNHDFSYAAKVHTHTEYATHEELNLYPTTNDIIAGYATINHTHAEYTTHKDLDSYITITDAIAEFATINHTHVDYATHKDLDLYLTKEDAAIAYALVQPGIAGTFETVDGKTITVLDGLITSII